MARKIYTKSGDSGKTGLFGGDRVSKDHPRVETYGAVDEANAVIGQAIAHETDPEIGGVLVEIQRQLMALGSMLASTVADRGVPSGPVIDDGAVRRLESWIDAAEAELPELTNFILPGGSRSAAALHLARTVVRRAERRAVALVRSDEADAVTVRFLNRLSDLLFVLARLSNRRSGEPDAVWKAAPGDEAG